MYLGLFCLFVGLIVLATTISKVNRVVATVEEVYRSIKWSIILFEANIIGLLGGMCLKYLVKPVNYTLLVSWLIAAATIFAVVCGIILVPNINEWGFKTYKYFTTNESKRFNTTMWIVTIIWLAIYYFY